MKRFALIGAAGYVAPRHLQAIQETGHTLIAGMDIRDPAGIISHYFPAAASFTSFEQFENYLSEQNTGDNKTDYLTVCTPNHLHNEHIRFGLKLGADVICEKPIVLDPWDVDALVEAEKQTGRNVFTILQMRLHPAARALKKMTEASSPGKRYTVNLQYITARGSWYHASWKGDRKKSGGIATNIGVHFFDLLLWVFGGVKRSKVNLHTDVAAAGELELERADVNWQLSIEENALPLPVKAAGKQTYRVLTIDGESFDFSEGFADLHTQSYAAILSGHGFPLVETREVIRLVQEIRSS